MYETSAEPDTPRISVVSTIVNQPVIQPFLFCNYRHHPDNREATHYLSTCDVRGWEAVMASTAAPGYFEEVKLGNFVHQVRLGLGLGLGFGFGFGFWNTAERMDRHCVCTCVGGGGIYYDL
jgi:hypothetical protein